MRVITKRGAVGGRPSTSKFGNRKTAYDGITFDSLAEAKRYSELKLLERAGVITGLVLQPRYPLSVNGVKICTYVADFSYTERGLIVAEDTKGFRTPVYVIKSKMFQALYPEIKFVEVAA